MASDDLYVQGTRHNGKVVEGTLDADNQSLVASRLREMGYTPVNIQAKIGRRHATWRSACPVLVTGSR